MDTNQDQPQSTPKQQVVERLKQAANVLVTVKSNPNVDELASAIGLTLMLNKLDKHTTAVFSGEVPSTIEFLRPEETLETNTDSLRDFIVSLDKSKADKLRYKVEENVVKIYITPYRTSITEADLEFTQGDFNVDAIIALGVTQREELDQAITMHGRILHDATVITVTAGQDVSELGQINWQEPGASSLSEMLVSISEAFQGGLIDEQIATAYLTGIVAETERFSNPKTSPKVMTMAAQLMAAGANQQLIANELEKAVEVDVQTPATQTEGSPEASEAEANSDGTLSIQHTEPSETETSIEPESDNPEPSDETGDESAEPEKAPSEKETSSFLPRPETDEQPDHFNPLMDNPESEESTTPEQTTQEPDPPVRPVELPPVQVESPEEDNGQIHIDHEGNLIRNAAANPKHKIIQPLVSEPTTEPAPDDTEPAPRESPKNVLPPPPELDLTPSKPIPDTTTLEQLEHTVNSHHVSDQAPQVEGVGSARTAVESALGQASFDEVPAPRTDLNAMPLESPASTSFDAYRLPDSPGTSTPASSESSPAGDNLAPQVPNGMPLHTLGEIIPENNQNDQMSPPPVPPPMFPQS